VRIAWREGWDLTLASVTSMKVLGMDKTVEVTPPFLVVIPDAQEAVRG